MPLDIIKKSFWHGSSMKNETINPVAMRQPHQTDNLLSWCILQCCCPALAPDHRHHSPPHPSGSGRKPSSASAWRRPGEGRGYFWQAESWYSKINISAQWCALTGQRLLKLQKWYYRVAAHLSCRFLSTQSASVTVYFTEHHLTGKSQWRGIHNSNGATRDHWTWNCKLWSVKELLVM